MAIRFDVDISVGISQRAKTVDKIANNIDITQDISDSRAVDKVDNNVDISVGISVLRKTLEKIANNDDVKQVIVDGRAVDKLTIMSNRR